MSNYLTWAAVSLYRSRIRIPSRVILLLTCLNAATAYFFTDPPAKPVTPLGLRVPCPEVTEAEI
jgi:hypothetical protein